jgi:ABC-type amino acid transport substrate-binding protein
MGRRQGKLTRTLLGALFSFWVGSFLGVSMAQAAEAEVVIAVSGSSKPFAYENEQGQTEGFNFDLANLICGKLKKACRVEIMPFADVLAGVSEGKVSIAIANLLKTPEREKVMLFSKPIWRLRGDSKSAPSIKAANGPISTV